MADKSPFEEEFTAEEEAALNDATAIPPAEEEGEGTVEDAIAEAGQAPAPAAAPDPAAAPAADPAAAPAATAPTAEEVAAADEAELAAFIEKHKGKSADEVLKLAFQQGKRANREAAGARQVKERISAVADRVRQAAERRTQLNSTAADVKAKFRERLEQDPDAATAELFEALVDQRLNAADAEVQTARVEEALVFADTYIPEFGKQWPGMKSLANEVGYSDDELNAIDDGRPLLILSLANHAARLMKAGIMDRFGNIVQAPEMSTQPVDPRLAAPDPQRTLGGGPRGAAKGSQSVEQQLNSLLEMSDDELAKFDAANPGAIEQLMRAAA